MTDADSVPGDAACVVIPAYNAARYLGEAARSALAQTHAALELVVVDDGSTDDTLAVARALDDRRVRVLHVPNGGRARARNLGVAAARPSAYVAFLDADDVWDADKLATQLAWLAAHPDAAGVGSFMRYISSTGRVLGETGQEIDDAAHALVARAELAPFPVSSCLVVRRAAFDTLGGFDPALREAEDLEFMARLARLGRVRCVPRVLGSYRIHPESAMARRRLLVNQYARFVRQRLGVRDAGGELTWEAFAAAYRPGWRERWRDRAEVWYRSAALWHGEGRRWRALRFGALAAAAAPWYTLRRVYRQRFARVGLRNG
ncbi:glycosyl transferase [Gemmatimonadetes bacterium T265]|nr:glycosyl transferase [Gemmatimonadetes bacterium T265]